jgi:DNA primase large subunit
MKPLLEKYLPLDTNTAPSAQLSAQRLSAQRLSAQRQKDHYSHFILRLAFASTEDLRRRFNRVETMLFQMRFKDDYAHDRAAFVQSLNLDWEIVSDEEKRELAAELAATNSFDSGKKLPQSQEEESWCKVDWERVPELVERRKVFLKAGKAYVPAAEQQSMVVQEFSSRLEKALEVGRRSVVDNKR